MKTISLIGCGDFGSTLAIPLLAKGYSVKGTTRDLSNLDALKLQGLSPFTLTREGPLPKEAFDADIVVLNIPPFEGQLDWFKTFPLATKTWVIFISSTSVYGTQAGELTEEVSLLPDTVSAHTLVSEERWVQETFSHWNILRLGGIVSSKKKPARFLSGKENVKSKNWPVNLIYLEDAANFCLKLIEENIVDEVYNVVCDEHSTRETFYTRQAILHGLIPPTFDPLDQSPGKTIVNAKMKARFDLSVPTMLDRSL